ncbi:MAG: GNAT family N-acetyltransferase [Pseudomonadota bacterium]
MIKDLSPDDYSTWRDLWDQYLVFYGTTLSDAQTELTWSRLLDPLEPMNGFGAFDKDRLVGIAHFLTHRSTWAENGYVYLEDLFVDPSARGGSYGRKLIEATYAYADKGKLSRVYWATQNDNVQARRLYDALATESEFVQYRR